MALSEARRKIRIESFRNAAEMIRGHLEIGEPPDEIGVTEDDFLMEAENQRTAKLLEKMANKLENA